MVWDEVEIAQKDKRYELVLHGPHVSRRIRDNGLDKDVFRLTNLNFLQISQTELDAIPEVLGELINLRTLDLHQNKLAQLPPSVGKLFELKYFDISGNCLMEVPEELGNLTNLHTLNLSCNFITALPSFTKLVHLSKFDCSHNRLANFPPGIHQLQSLSEIRASNNVIESISGDIAENGALKVLDLSDNKLKTLPVELGECHKLKELTLINNPITNNRLNKLIKQCSTKSVLDYVRSGDGKSKGKGKKDRKQNSKSIREENVEDLLHVIRIERSDKYKVIAKANIVDVRPYIVCVVAKNIDLTQPEVFKKFINIQTKLHESACDHRTAATIATHCLTSLQFPLIYEAHLLSEINLVPLGKHELLTGTEILADLKATALKEKQRTKRQPKSGLSKFLSLVQDAETLTCVRSNQGDVISLHPVTNSELSKISSQCMDIFIEVTSPCALNVCKTVMDELIKRMYEAGMHSVCNNERSTSESLNPGKKELVLVQVHVTDEEENLKVVYPSKTDLSVEGMVVVH